MMTLLALLPLLLSPAAASPAAASTRNVLAVCDDVQDPLTLDPHKQFAEKNHTLLQQIFEGLVRFDPQGRIEPALAISWERRDPLRMRFHLRRDVRFHDGEPFDAESVRFTVARYLDPKTGFPALGFISSLDKVEIVDDHTVDIVTKFPDGLLLNRLAGFVLVVPARYMKEKGETSLELTPVGTGPFRFERWDRGRSLTLSRNEAYWNRGYPKAGGLVFKFIPTSGQLKALLAGEIDIATELAGTQTTEAMRSGFLKVIKTPSFYTVTGSLNSSRAPLSDKRVRQALNYAVNTEELIRYDLLGNGREIATVTMAGEEGHNPRLKPYPYDPRKAKSLLKEAGYEAGFTLKALVKVQGERAAKIVGGQLAKIGVVLDAHLITDAEVVRALTNDKWDVFIAGCPDPMAHSYFIQSVYLYGRSPYRVADNPAYDALLERMVATLDDGKRRELAEDLDRYMYDEALLIFLYQRIKTYGVGKGVDFVPAITGMPYFFGVGKAGVP
ncbi:MAG: ABC transporter substrate-binding protein [Elusimicrobia bacterium]|nr:ABC transporter substrate-binding protein [Elusimicrobiota bacterium]